MKVNIVCDDVGWIYSQFIKQFGFHSRHKIYLNTAEKVDLTYYLPYYTLSKNPTKPCVIWSSHRENKDPLKTKFITSAQQANYALCHAQKYVGVLKSHGIQNVKQILPGVDLDQYTIQPSKRGKKLVVGWIGRSYTSSSRKNETLLAKIAKLPGVELRITGGKVAEKDMPDFYAGCNVIISTSLIEGGPMSNLEALSCGKTFICFDDVGTSREFKHGNLTVPFNDEAAFLARVKSFAGELDYYDQPEIRQQMRAQIRSWKSFIEDHDQVFEEIYENVKP